MNEGTREKSNRWTRVQWRQSQEEAEKQKLTKKSRKELTKEKQKHFGDILHKNTDKDHIIIGFVKIQLLPKSRTVKTN